jgi:hypothetical protein
MLILGLQTKVVFSYSSPTGRAGKIAIVFFVIYLLFGPMFFHKTFFF